jgi:hypothetical protein
MPLLKVVSPKNADGKIKEAYSFFEKMGAPVPLPMQMVSTSPDLLAILSQTLQYFVNHPTLSFPLLAHIRLLVADKEDYPYCVKLNEGMLQVMGGLTKEQIDAAKVDPEKAQLPAKDKALLLHVLKVIQDPALSEQKDVDALRSLGWTDRDIFDAINHGLSMVSAGMAFKIFHMGK